MQTLKFEFKLLSEKVLKYDYQTKQSSLQIQIFIFWNAVLYDTLC